MARRRTLQAGETANNDINHRATPSSLLLVSPLHGSLIGNDETRSESWGAFLFAKIKKRPKKASRAMTDFTAFYVNDEGPFTPTPPIHTHYYTPRDNND
jgi:hypothetical protein